MKYLILNELNSFECIGSKCSYTCCRGWKVDIDAESAEIYRNVNGAFGEKLKNSVIDDAEGHSYFKSEIFK